MGSDAREKFDLKKEIKEVPFIPLFARIIVKEKVVEQIGLIIMAEDSEEKRATEGIVLAVGVSVTSMKAGDNVLYGQYCGTKIIRNGKTYQVMNDDDVIAKIKEGR